LIKASPTAPTLCAIGDRDALFCATNGLEKTFADGRAGLEDLLARHAPAGPQACHEALQAHLDRLPNRATFPDDITYLLLFRSPPS
jgi:hypothetical protein